MTYSFNISECGLSRCIACRTITVSSSSGACSQDEAPDCASVLSARCGKRCTSCGQPIATAIRPAQYRASASPGTSTTAKPPRCSLVSVNGPSVKTGEPLLGSTLHTAVDASRPPSLKTKTPASVISSIRALAAVPLSRRSSTVRSGTHSSLKAIRYSAISSSSAHGQPERLPLTNTTNVLVPNRHPGQDFFQAFRIAVGPTACGRACRTKRAPKPRCYVALVATARTEAADLRAAEQDHRAHIHTSIFGRETVAFPEQGLVPACLTRR